MEPILEVVAKAGKFKTDIKNIWHAKLCTLMAGHAAAASLYFKHPAYAHEKEYRFLELHEEGGATDVKFRLRGKELVRYREFDWRGQGADVLQEVVIGPAVINKPTMLRNIKHFLKKHDLAHVEVRCSDIPYRCR